MIGVREARRVYRGKLQPLFTEDGPERCRIASELVKRCLGEDLERNGLMTQPATVRDYLRTYFVGLDREVFIALYLDAQNRMLFTEELSRGTLTQTSVFPREVVKGVLRANAAAVIFAHNHPSGLAEPSRADELLTQTLRQALNLIDVKVLDHFVVGGAVALSFAERGIL